MLKYKVMKDGLPCNKVGIETTFWKGWHAKITLSPHNCIDLHPFYKTDNLHIHVGPGGTNDYARYFYIASQDQK